MTTKKDITDAMKDNRLVIGINSVMRVLRSGNAEKIVVANNCDEKLKSHIRKHSQMSDVKMETFPGNNKELGTLCKKPFPISVLAVSKG